jgi:hypothetical protein
LLKHNINTTNIFGELPVPFIITITNIKPSGGEFFQHVEENSPVSKIHYAIELDANKKYGCTRTPLKWLDDNTTSLERTFPDEESMIAWKEYLHSIPEWVDANTKKARYDEANGIVINVTKITV